LKEWQTIKIVILIVENGKSRHPLNALAATNEFHFDEALIA
jgi:hypothetical protein